MTTPGKTENVNSSFFNGYYKDIWRGIFPIKTTIAEIDFIIEDCGLKPGSRVLDLMCGYGRHALELGRRGINVVAVDNLAEYVNEIGDTAKQEKLPVEAVLADVLELKLEQHFDAILCMGNSLQFFDAGEIHNLLSKISSHLKPGGRFYINTWMIMEIAVKQFQNRGWSRIDDLLFLTESEWLLQPSRIETKSIIINKEGDREEKIGIDYIYSLTELGSILNEHNLRLNEVYSVPGKKRFTVGDPRAYIVASKAH